MVNALHERYAHLLVAYCTSVEPDDVVMLNIETPALPMARALVREVLRAGGRPHLRLTYPEYTADVIECASDALFDSEPTVELEEMKRMDAYVRVAAPTNNRNMQGADASRVQRWQRRNQSVQERRVNATRWVGTLFPTASAAQAAGMSLDDYERFVFDAMFLFDDDPAARWVELRQMQAELVARLSKARELRIEADGTDLRLSVANRRWMNSDGKRNMPSGEVYTGPIESSAEGVITFDVPSTKNGALVEGVRLRFEAGKVVEATAERGQDVLEAQLATDAGARFLGEVGIGTNYRIQVATQQTLFDEKIGGTVHLALGRSYLDTGGVNESAIHWDLICDLRKGGRMLLDGEVFQQDGAFKV